MEKLRYFVFVLVIFFCASWISEFKAQDNPKDLAFVKDAASSGLFEVQSGKLALAKSSDKEVKELAQQMIADHSKASEELMALASRKKITLPDTMDAKLSQVYAKLGQLTGKDFDKAYIAALIKAHDTDVAKFSENIKTLNDSDIKAWASKTLPTLKMHQKHVHHMGEKGKKSS